MWVLYDSKGRVVAYTYSDEGAEKAFDRYSWEGYFLDQKSAECEVPDDLPGIDDETGKIKGQA